MGSSVCAVHGLNGNAFDTWMASQFMWLRDFLPSSHGFKNSRIMTFGYNSTLVNKGSEERLQDWANELLEQLSRMRTTSAEKQRPIIMICHSMGGLVARQAMIQLHFHPKRHRGIALGNCGLLYLSTPHAGTTQADWNDFVLNVSELFGVRTDEIVSQLKSFNKSLVDSVEDFSEFAKPPPSEHLVESKKTMIGGVERLVYSSLDLSVKFHGYTHNCAGCQPSCRRFPAEDGHSGT